MQAYEQHHGVWDAGFVVWLVWLLPRLALILVMSFVTMAVLGLDTQQLWSIVATGHGVELLVALVGALATLAAHSLGIVAQNWALVIVGSAGLGLVWAIRYM